MDVEKTEVVEPELPKEPEPEPEPEKKKRKKRDDAPPVRAPRVRRAKPSVVREELPPNPPDPPFSPPEVDANFFVQLGHNLRPSRGSLDSAASRASRLYKKMCHIVKRNARPRKIHYHDSQAAGDDGSEYRASTPVFGECLRESSDE